MTTNLLFIYLLKSILLSGIFYGYYLIFLRNNRFHAYNRFYLLICMALSVLVPFINFKLVTQEENPLSAAEQALFIISTISTKTQENSWISQHSYHVVLLIWGFVSLAFLGYLTHHIVKIYRLKSLHTAEEIGDIKLIETEHEDAPFSFFNLLFWKKSIDLTSSTGEAIFRHELTHIIQHHTLDRLFCQIVASFFWMNPFHWIMQKELQHIHEFIADQAAVGDENAASLAQMILTSQYGQHFLNPSHSFFYSPIKRRIIMLTTSQKPKHSYARKILALPLVVCCAIFFSIKLEAQQAEQKVKIKAEKPLAFIPLDDKKISTPKKPKLPKPPTPPLTPIMVVNGKVESEQTVKEIDPSEIKSIQILSKNIAIEKYGNQGKNGAVEMALNGTTPATYPGGMEAFSQFVAHNIQYPEDAKRSKITGKVYAQINLDEEGTIRDVNILRSPGYGLGEEAIRVIKSSGKWIPSKKEDKNVASTLVIPIKFEL